MQCVCLPVYFEGEMNDGTKTLLARAQLVLRPLAFGDVPSDPR